jgi:hypothetical protein
VKKQIVYCRPQYAHKQAFVYNMKFYQLKSSLIDMAYLTPPLYTQVASVQENYVHVQLLAEAVPVDTELASYSAMDTVHKFVTNLCLY